MMKLITTAIITGFIAITSMFMLVPAVNADAVSDAIQFCNKYESDTGVRCGQQRCPCGRSTKEVERWDRGGLRISVCACASKRDLEAAANAVPEAQCEVDSDCSDGIFCNGVEACRSGQCVASVKPCKSGSLCDETENVCKRECVDNDGDGFKAVHCGGQDCDDGNRNRFPGNIEICDARGIDEDCDPTTVGSLDRDGDGYISDKCR